MDISNYQYPAEADTAIDEIVTHIINNLNDEDRQELAKVQNERGLYRFHMTAGMGIRNKYHLWDKACPLTAQWYRDRAGNSEQWNWMDNGVDYHPQHPDNVSGEIMRRVWRRVVPA